MEATRIPGLLIVHLPLHGDNRGWFKENWQQEKMVARGLPDFGPIQNNISFNDSVGTTRGIHAEPWDKYISVATGKIFAAWVDLREGPTFGEVVTSEVGPETAVYVPRGVGNSYQTLEPNTAYTYLVNEHWSADADYAFLNLADETAAIDWPIPLADVEISAKDEQHPRLSHVTPIPPRKTLVLGAGGQLGRALNASFSGDTAVEFATRAELDALSPLEEQRDWRQYDTIINAAAYTKVDLAETEAGRREAWLANAELPANLAALAAKYGITLVHISSDYVFDGTKVGEYGEEDQLCPLGVYGQTKAAGDIAALTAPGSYVLRTSWVIGEGNNFVRTMANLAKKGVKPRVVDDQIGRLTFTDELARAVRHLLSESAPYGVYNVTGGGAPASWADLAKAVYESVGADPEWVTPVSAGEYYAKADGPVAPRPRNSVLNLTKLVETGFQVEDQWRSLTDYLEGERSG